MYRLIVILLYLLHSTNAGELQNSINLNFSLSNNTVECHNDTQFTLRENVPTNINIIGYVRNINKHWCYHNQNSQINFTVTKFIKGDNSTSANVVRLMTGEIICQFWLNKDISNILPQVYYDGYIYTHVVCKFKIGLIYSASLKVELNGKVLDNKPEINSKYVHASTQYKFVHKEFVDIKCMKPPDVSGKLSAVLPQYNYTSKPEILNEVTLQMVLENQETTKIDCVFESQGTATVLRIYLSPTTKADENIIRVNDIAIRPQNSTFTYNYHGDKPKVLCGNEQLADDAKVCNINGENKTIQLRKYEPANDININGLSDEAILLQISSTEIVTIYYAYTDDDVIEFNGTHSSQKKDIIWEFIKGSPHSTETMTYSFRYTMNKKYNQWKAICTLDDSKKTEIIFVYKEEMKKPNTPDGETDGKDTDESTTAKSIQDENAEKQTSALERFLHEHMTKLIGGILAIILVIILICLLIVLKKRRNSALKGEQTDVNYVNLEHNNPNAQFPKTLNVNAYIQPPKESDDYAVPVDLSDDGNPYSVPYKQKLEDLYAKPFPKSQRGNKSVDDITYAEVQFDRPDNMYSKIKNNDVTYAELQPVKGKDLYASVKPKSERGNEYVNDFTCSNYVNVHSDYVEPAYCEINALRK